MNEVHMGGKANLIKKWGPWRMSQRLQHVALP